LVAVVRGQLDELIFEALWAEGQVMTLEEAVAKAAVVAEQNAASNPRSLSVKVSIIPTIL
jgi:hypothetical protein